MRNPAPAVATALLLTVTMSLPSCRHADRTPPPAITASVAVPPASAAAKDAAPDPSPAPHPSTGRVHCGDARCRAVTQTCCEYGDIAACITSVPPGPHDDAQPLANQNEACEHQVKHQYALERLRRCDDSSDCAEREMCCEMWLYSGAARFVCEPMQSGGQSVCDYGEACVEGLPCRTSGTECVEGQCRKVLSSRRCGSADCSGDQPACCGEPDQPTCQSRAECRRQMANYECSRPEDCPPGEHCQSGIMGTTCQGMLDGAHLVVVCSDDADCVEKCWEPGQTRKCLSDGWFKTCQCQ